jgi:hypothetical protein
MKKMVHNIVLPPSLRAQRCRPLCLWVLTATVLTALALPGAPTRADGPRNAEQAQSPRMMVALVLGQSNAANFGESRRMSGPGVYNLYRGWLYRARDPLRGANGQTGSVWTRLGDKLIAEKLYNTVIFVPAAVGATEIERWAPEGDLHPLILKAIEDAQKRRLKITHLLWHQGESDAVLRTSRLEYKLRFLAMLASIRAHGVDAPIFVAVATRCGQYLPSSEIESAQRELIDPGMGIYPGPNTDVLDEHFRYDGCHFSDEGLDIHASLWVQSLKANIELITPTPTPAPTPSPTP